MIYWIKSFKKEVMSINSRRLMIIFKVKYQKGIFVWAKCGDSAALRLDAILQIFEINCKYQIKAFEMQKIGLKTCHIPCKSVRQF